MKKERTSGRERASYPTSIITRIETNGSQSIHWNVWIDFLPHFHYNKDWNPRVEQKVEHLRKTSYPTSIITRIETKDWLLQCYLRLFLLTPLPL